MKAIGKTERGGAQSKKKRKSLLARRGGKGMSVKTLAGPPR